MATVFTIPSVFTGVDQLSPTVARMKGNIIGFANSAEAAFNRIDRSVRKMTPGLGNAQKQLLSMVGTGAALAGGFQLGGFSFNSLANYEQAVDSFRVIVSDLNDADFTPFQNKINEVARETKRGGTEVAQAFEKIAGINSKFAESADGLGMVTKATITLAKASRMDLGVAAENLVGIMNQFSFGADKANRVINVLAAGQAVGAANISQTAEAFTVFGSIAAGTNITLEQSVGLIQTLGKYSLYGAEAGTKLRGAILRLQKAGIGYASGQFNINDALTQTNTILAKVTDAKRRDQLTNKLFGVENVTAGRILLKNIDTYQKFTSQVTGTSEAQKAAAINSGNLRTVIQQLGAAWERMLVESSNAGSGMNKISQAAQWLTRNLGTVVSTVVTATKIWLGYKAVMIASQVVFTAWNVTLGISTALQGASSIAMKGNTVALAAQKVAILFTTSATVGATEAQWGLNAAMAANPVGIVLLGITALASAIGFLVYRENKLNEEFNTYLKAKHNLAIDAERKAVDDLTDSYEKNGKTRKEAIALSLQQRMLENRNDIANAQLRISRANNVMSNNNSFSEQYQTALRQRQGATSDLLFRQESGSALNREADRARETGMISGINRYNLGEGKPLNFIEQSKVDKYRNEKYPQQKDEINPDSSTVNQILDVLKSTIGAEITIKNETNNDISVKNKTNITSVQPGMTSTKFLTPAYGR